MDEPTSALDPIATNRIEELLLDLKNEFTILIVTHNMSQAARISDYSMFMYLGHLIEYDETQKMFTNPSDKRTEEYLTGQLIYDFRFSDFHRTRLFDFILNSSKLLSFSL